MTVEMVPAPPHADPRTLEQQVFGVADYVTEIIQQGLRSTQNVTEKENQKNAN
jgi:hypothetical protein